MKNVNKNYLSIAISLACVSLALPALAQDTLTLEEVVVTAQKRAQSLQEVPLSVQALLGDTLTQNGISTLSDLSSISPGFKLADTQGTNNVSALRGVNSFAFGFGLEESIPFYLDGVYLGNGFDMLGDLLDIQRVEVLKGPQGTLFGRNASGGAISIIRNKPNNEFAAEIGAGGGNYGLRTTKGLINVPVIADELMVRAGFTTRDRDGWQTNVATGQEDGLEQDRAAGFLRALWVANDSLELEYSADWSSQKDHPGYKSVSTVRPGSGLFGFVWNQADPASFYSEGSGDAIAGDAGFIIPVAGGLSAAPAGANPETIQDRNITGNSLKVSWDLSEDLTLTSISSYRKVDTKTGSDADGGSLGLANSYATGTTKELNQEFRINASSDTVDWLAGVNYYKQERDLAVTTRLSALVKLRSLGGGSLGTPFMETSAGENETESYSIFGDATWQLTDQLNFTAGIRYTHDEKSFTLIDAGNNTFAGQGLIYPNIAQLSDPSISSWSEDWSNISGRIGLDYALNDEAMVFASISQGYKSGGYNTRLTLEGSAANGFVSPDFATTPFDEENNINYELGIKSDLLDGRMRFNSSVFYYVYEDLQVLLTDGTSPVARTVNASEVTGYGWDTEVVYLATEGLTLSLNLLALDAEYTDDVVDNTDVLRIEEGSGRPWAPDWSTTMNVDYRTTLEGLGELRANLTYAYQDDQPMRSRQVTQTYTDEDNSQEAYGLLNGRLSFNSADEHWEVAVWGKNILDEDYKNSLIASSDSVAGILMTVGGEPRTFGLDAMYRF